MGRGRKKGLVRVEGLKIRTKKENERRDRRRHGGLMGKGVNIWKGKMVYWKEKDGKSSREREKLGDERRGREK